jgi:hypothetical protein
MGAVAQAADPKAHRFDLQRSKELRAEEAEEMRGLRKLRPDRFLSVLLSTSLESAFERAAWLQAEFDLARCGVALERFRLKHGEYPETLEGVAEFLAVPNDPLSGEPIRYRREADGTFTLYLIGGNKTDEGGRSVPLPIGSWRELEKDDLVWPRLKAP